MIELGKLQIKLGRIKRRLVVGLLLLVVGLSGSTYYALQLAKPRALEPVVTALPAPVVKQSTPSSKTLPRSEPVRLRISKIGVNATFTTVGRQADNTMQTPNGPWIVGWYKYSPTPGELGPAVVVGHVDWVSGIAVFWRLRELQPGDMVQIDRADGRTVAFRVDSIQQFSQDNFPTQQVYGNIDHAGIRLITCGGVFNSQTHHYNQNTVVFGSLVI